LSAASDHVAEIAELRADVRHLSEAVEKLSESVALLTAQANRWRGGLAVVLALGGIAGWFAEHLWDKLK
jgi:hypothetical protein